ncbi:alpha/beta fold hydrolase [Amycolatopsis cihanbeyliensis]|uniref:Pimeloyl-ACP methyl ester carboxylesterase n=1 Tax=Amycolatopsis cihanbeyliensis TaxID=1128664 RepID=A0A542DGX7_AMYCI|nr:alpha/beta hydrolase [Amycolatopsis cihanbeyliensis]TQJ02337.1 pimeloyl-ACP methyl ester carboxylesterase [Amycolatopsis cihanbeyliensis]
MAEVELSAGPIEYQDTGGDGPVLLLLHGVTINGSVWRNVVSGLRADYRCVTPTLPLGAHRTPMKPEADLSLRGMALLVEEFLERLDLHEVTLVLNDWGGAQILLAEGRTERIARVVLTACEAFDNYPPGLPGRVLDLVLRVPGGTALLMKALLHLPPLRRAPGAWGWMSKRPVPDEVIRGWFRPAATNAEIRRDLAKYALSVPPRETLLDWAWRMRSFDRPVLIVWATEDKLMPLEHGHRLDTLFPNASIVEVDGSYTLVPEDQPELLTELLREFVPR